MSSLAEATELLQTVEAILQHDPTNAEALELKATAMTLLAAFAQTDATTSSTEAPTPADVPAAAPSVAASAWAVGARVVALWPEDQQLYVARIESEPEPGRYHVLYLQYGNSDTVDAAHIHAFAPPCALAPGATVAAFWPEDGLFYEATITAVADPSAKDNSDNAAAAAEAQLPMYSVRFSHNGVETERSAQDVYDPTAPLPAAPAAAPAVVVDSKAESETQTGTSTAGTATESSASASADAVPALEPVPAADSAASAEPASAVSAPLTATASVAVHVTASANSSTHGHGHGHGAAPDAGPEPYWPRDMPPIDSANPGAAVWIIPPRLLVLPTDSEAEKRLKLYKTKKLKETFWRRVRELQEQASVSSWKAFQSGGTAGARAGGTAGAAKPGFKVSLGGGPGAAAGRSVTAAAAFAAEPAAAAAAGTSASAAAAPVAAHSHAHLVSLSLPNSGTGAAAGNLFGAAGAAKPKLSLSAAVALKKRSMFSSAGPGVAAGGSGAGVAAPGGRAGKLGRTAGGRGDVSGAWGDEDE